MANFMVGRPRWSDEGAITTTDETSYAPASNLQIMSPKRVWETPGAPAAPLYCQANSPDDVLAVALIGTNASNAAQWRVRLGGSQAEVDGTPSGADGYDSGVVDFIAAGGDSTWRVRNGMVYLPTPTTNSSWLRIDITDAGTDPFRAGRLMVISSWVSTTNFNAGSDFWGLDDPSEQIEGEDGSIFVDRRTARRVVSGTVVHPDGDEVRTNFVEIARRAGLSRDVLYSSDPADASYLHQHMMQGLFTRIGRLRALKGDLWTFSFEVRECV